LNLAGIILNGWDNSSQRKTMGGVRGYTMGGMIPGLISEFIGIGALKFREALEVWITTLQRGGSGGFPPGNFQNLIVK
jgi:hypothetical protein